MTKICKEVWLKHELHAYCDKFDGTSPSDMTTTDSDTVTCDDCKTIIALETSIIKQLNEV